MTALTLVTYLTEGLFVLIAVMLFVDLVRYGGRARLDLLLIFGVLVGYFAIQNATTVIGQRSQWADLIGALLVCLHPALMLRGVEHFIPVPRAVRWAALAGLLISTGLLLASGFPSSPPNYVTIPLAVYFVAVEGYVSWAFLRGALTAVGVARKRLILAAFGALLFASLMLLLGIHEVVKIPKEFRSVVNRLLLSGSGLCYYLAFGTPRWLRRAWQLAEFHRFLRTTSAETSETQGREIFRLLCEGAVRGVGGTAIIASLDHEVGNLNLGGPAARQKPGTGESESIISLESPLGRVLESRRPMFAMPPGKLGAEIARVARVIHAMTVYAVPIATSRRAWGVLLVFRQNDAAFVADDLEVLNLFAEHSALMLGYAGLVEEQHRLIGELQSRGIELEASNRELEAFSYSVSHDLRAPLRSLDGFSRIVLEDYGDRLDDEGKGHLTHIQDTVHSMGRLIDDLLQLARITRSEMRLMPVNMEAAGHSIMDELHKAHPGRDVEFVASGNLMVTGDNGLLRAALQNLLGNAWKFTGKRPQARIEFGVTEKEGQRTYHVRDNGAGFDAAYAHKLFGEFQRLHSAAEFPGTGIGLATVRRIIHRHGGRIWAEGSPDQGATFYFTLPENQLPPD